MATLVANGNAGVFGLRTASSSESILALLEEDDDYLKAHALRALNQGNNIMNHWHEVAEYVSEIEALSEVRSFPAGRRRAYPQCSPAARAGTPDPPS